MKTTIDDLVKFCHENITTLNGNKVIDFDLLYSKFNELYEKEKKLIILSYKTAYLEREHLDYYPDKHSKEWYDELLKLEE